MPGSTCFLPAEISENHDYKNSREKAEGFIVRPKKKKEMNKKTVGLSLVAAGLLMTAAGIFPILTSSYESFEKFRAKLSATPMPVSFEPVPPFTNNDNRTAPLLWSMRVGLPRGAGCYTEKSKMFVGPKTIVFFKVADDSTGEMKAGIPGDRRRLSSSPEWRAVRFVEPGKAQQFDITLTKREPFVVCDATENMYLHLEARRLP